MSPKSKIYPMITNGKASIYIDNDGNPIESGDVLSNNVTTSGKAKPHVMSNVASPTEYATIPAIKKPGRRPRDAIF